MAITPAHDIVNTSPTNVFATLNSLKYTSNISSSGLSDGNLRRVSAGGYGFRVTATISIEPNTGKWYFETIRKDTQAIGNENAIGVVKTSAVLATNQYSGSPPDSGANSNEWVMTDRAYACNGSSYENTSLAGHSIITGDITQVLIDTDTGSITWGVNGTWYNSLSSYRFTNISESVTPIIYTGTGDIVINFGQDHLFGGTSLSTEAQNAGAGSNTPDNGIGTFAFSVPSGAKALCTKNIQSNLAIDPAVGDAPEDHFKAVIWSGTGSDQNVDLEFNADLVWAKRRNGNDSHRLYDSIRGETKDLVTDSTGLENTNDYGLGFTNSNTRLEITGSKYFGNSANTFCAWCWKAGGGPSSSDPYMVDNVSKSASNAFSGSYTITPTRASIGTKQGFSIISYTSNPNSTTTPPSTDTLPHGLTSAPELIIVKQLNSSTNWMVWHKDLTTNYNLHLNTTDDEFSVSGGGIRTPSSSAIDLGGSLYVNSSWSSTAQLYICYAWHSVEGYSSFGSYSGSSGLPFIFIGFKPAWILIKRTDVDNGWEIHDNVRDPHNPSDEYLMANENSYSFGSASEIDFLSNGFKIRTNGNSTNNSSGTYVYACFSEMPFKYAATNAR